jgi:hypothetical protein
MGRHNPRTDRMAIDSQRQPTKRIKSLDLYES